jgi:hypothetical protein
MDHLAIHLWEYYTAIFGGDHGIVSMLYSHCMSGDISTNLAVIVIKCNRIATTSSNCTQCLKEASYTETMLARSNAANPSSEDELCGENRSRSDCTDPFTNGLLLFGGSYLIQLLL